MSPMLRLIELASARPIYISSAATMPTMQVDQIVDQLTADYRAASFVNSRGRYRDYDGWRKSWGLEYHRYGAVIVLTHPDIYDNGHYVADSAVVEITYMLHLSRPILWFPASKPMVERFSVVQDENGSSPMRCAGLIANDDCHPFTPTVTISMSWRSLRGLYKDAETTSRSMHGASL